MGDEKGATVEVRGSEILIRIQAPPASAPGGSDRLVGLDAKGAAAEGFELRGLQALVREGRLAVVKIGRRKYVRYSDLLALPQIRDMIKRLNIELACQRGAAGFSALRIANVGEDDVAALGRQRSGDIVADTVERSGDQRAASFQHRDLQSRLV